MHDSKLLDSIGTAQMENEIQTKVAALVRQNQDDIEKESGVLSNVNEHDIKEYLKEVLKEIERNKISQE